MFAQRAGMLAGLAAIVCASLGCRNRAYTEVYVDNMAAEIRSLEDQLYQYDYEYKALEQDLETLRAENERLRSTSLPYQEGAKTQAIPEYHDQSSLQFQPRQEPHLSPAEIVVPAPLESHVPNGGAAPPMTGGGQVPGANSILDRSSSAAPDAKPDAKSVPESKPTLPPANPQSPPNYPGSPAPGATTQPGTTTPPGEAGSIKLDELHPPTIQPGTPMPPRQPVLPEKGAPITGKSFAPNQMEINLGRIEIPGQMAAASTGQGRLKLLSESVPDSRLVELAFHSTFCRAQNFDDQPDDDGLYLVLQPKSDRGQFVPKAAELSIVVLDPAREGAAARISQWHFSASDVQSKIEPIGSSQGIHLSLRWNGPDPIADRVVVFARYTLPDGRKLMSNKEIFVSSGDHNRTVWVPRDTNGVQPAARLAQPERRGVPRANPSPVVRPASAALPVEPAPPPRR